MIRVDGTLTAHTADGSVLFMVEPEHGGTRGMFSNETLTIRRRR